MNRVARSPHFTCRMLSCHHTRVVINAIRPMARPDHPAIEDRKQPTRPGVVTLVGQAGPEPGDSVHCRRSERRGLIEAQVAATRPIISGVILSGALILAMTGIFEAIGAAPGIGYPWWVMSSVAARLPGAHWRSGISTTGGRGSALTLLSTVLLGVFLSIPTPGVSGQLAIRTGLFQLLPIALLALLARPFSVACLVVVMLALAYVRVAMHGAPSHGRRARTGSTRGRRSASAC